MHSSQLFDFTVNYFPLVFIILFILGFVVLALIIKFTSDFISNRKIYKAKSFNLLNKSEVLFFNALSKVIPPIAFICPKVRIADLVDVDSPEWGVEFWPSFNKISQKHVDFVICDRIDFAPQLVIELDGESHKEERRQKRDQFVDKVFSDANIPILHIATSSFYDYKSLRNQINTVTNINI